MQSETSKAHSTQPTKFVRTTLNWHVLTTPTLWNTCLVYTTPLQTAEFIERYLSYCLQLNLSSSLLGGIDTAIPVCPSDFSFFPVVSSGVHAAQEG